MNEELRQHKQILRRALREHFPDAKLTQLVDHARSGKLAYTTCCCFVGILTADHKDGQLRGTLSRIPDKGHLDEARRLLGRPWVDIEHAFCQLGYLRGAPRRVNDVRRRRIIPIILAEIKRRSRMPVNLPVPETQLKGDSNHG